MRTADADSPAGAVLMPRSRTVIHPRAWYPSLVSGGLTLLLAGLVGCGGGDSGGGPTDPDGDGIPAEITVVAGQGQTARIGSPVPTAQFHERSACRHPKRRRGAW